MILVLTGLVGLVHAGVAPLASMPLFGRLLPIGGAVGLLHAVQARGDSLIWPGVVSGRPADGQGPRGRAAEERDEM